MPFLCTYYHNSLPPKYGAQPKCEPFHFHEITTHRNSVLLLDSYDLFHMLLLWSYLPTDCVVLRFFICIICFIHFDNRCNIFKNQIHKNLLLSPVSLLYYNASGKAHTPTVARPKAPSGRELDSEADWGRVRNKKVTTILKSRRLLPSRYACHLPLGGRLSVSPIIT